MPACRNCSNLRFCSSGLWSSPPPVQIQFFERSFGFAAERQPSPRRQLAVETPNAPWLSFPMNDRRFMIGATVEDLIPKASVVLEIWAERVRFHLALEGIGCGDRVGPLTASLESSCTINRSMFTT